MKERGDVGMKSNGDWPDVMVKEVSRRKLLRGAALGAVGLAAAGIGTACGEGGEAKTARGGVPQTFEIQLGEGEIIGEEGGKDVITGEYHRWEPIVLVAFRGDKIVLKVKNPRKNTHSFVLPAFNIDTGPLQPRGGEKAVEFVADKAGVFAYGCGTPFVEGKAECDPDHARMVGHLIVLNV